MDLSPSPWASTGHRQGAGIHALRPDGQSDRRQGHRSCFHVRLTPYSRKTALTSNLLAAGLGQFYLGQKTRGWIYLLTEAGGLVTALSAEMQRSDYRNDFLLLQERYNTASTPKRSSSSRCSADQAYQDMEDMEELRDTGLLVAGGAIILSMLDTLVFFPSAVDLGPGPVAPATGLRMMRCSRSLRTCQPSTPASGWPSDAEQPEFDRHGNPPVFPPFPTSAGLFTLALLTLVGAVCLLAGCQEQPGRPGLRQHLRSTEPEQRKPLERQGFRGRYLDHGDMGFPGRFRHPHL